MWRMAVGAVTIAAVGLLLVGSSSAQDVRAEVRTYQGASYTLANPSLETYYTIGEPKETPQLGPTMTINVNQPSSGGGGEQAAAGYSAPPGGAKEEKLLRGHSQATEITLSKGGATTRIPLDRIRSMSFARTQDTVAGLPPYMDQYRYSLSVTLVDGGRVDGDYVNLGTTILRGETPTGRVDLPWQDVEAVNFGR